MNGRAAKQMRKEVRAQMGDEVKFVGRVLIPRPDRMPFWLWLWGAKFYYSQEYLAQFKQIKNAQSFTLRAIKHQFKLLRGKKRAPAQVEVRT